MTVSETSKILYVIRATYPSQFARFTERDERNQLQVWSAVLSDYTYQQVSAGLKIYIASDTKGYPPSPGQVIDCIGKMAPQDKGMSELAAWEMVYAAICNSNYNSEEEFSKLPDVCKKAVGNPANLRQWAQTDSETVSGVIMSQFLRSYRAEMKRAEDFSKMPSSVKEFIEQSGMASIAQSMF